MKCAVILCAGAGTKIWPYAQTRCKAMIPVSNKPIAAYAADDLTELGFEKIIIVGHKFIEELRNHFRDYENVKIVADREARGTAFSLLAAAEEIGGSDFFVFYGDTILAKEDIASLVEYSGKSAVLARKIESRSSDHIGCRIDCGKISEVWGHSRGESTHMFAGFSFKNSFLETAAHNSGRFTRIEVGMMPHAEAYLEMSLADEMKRGTDFEAVEAKNRVFDIDRPWNILEANRYINTVKCSALTKNELAEGAKIDESVVLKGFVKLGKNSKIATNAIIEGNIIVGDNVQIFNGAIVQKNTVIGDGSSIRNACFISECSTVGRECIVSHAAELDGMIMDRVYLYHYMEIFGLVGENTDFGAATVCGSLRFDDGTTPQKINGRREAENDYSDATFIGDYCRTGVNAILMPGVKVGTRSVVGSGVILNEDVPDNTMIYAKQELIKRPWGSEKYGW